MSSQEQELFSELHMYMLYIVSKGTSCYTQFRYLILRDTRYLLKLCFTEIHELFVTYYTYQPFKIGVRFT